jgi:chromatin remodeling complex protein RSC6
MSKYVEELDGGFVRVLNGKTTYKKSAFAETSFEEFKEKYQGKIDTDIKRTYELLTGKKASVKKPSPRKKRSSASSK